MKSNQKGFSVVEILIVIVVVGLLGTVGWLVYDRQNSKTNDSKTATQTTQPEQKQEVSKVTTQQEDVPEGWIEYDSNSQFSFIYPKDWESDVKVTEYPTSEVFKIRYVGEIKLNPQFDGWIHATTDNGATVGSKADVIQEETTGNLKIWRFGFGDAGFGSFIPTFVAGGKLYQITTSGFCAEKTADCVTGEEYRQVYDKLVASIKLL